MTIEANLTSIAKSLEIIATYLSTTKNVQTTTIETTHSATPVPAAPVVSAPVSPSPVVTAVAAPVVAVPVAPVAAMPAVPVFTPAVAAPVIQAPAPAAPTMVPSPFKDKQAMMDFVIASYKALGAEKGAKIQDVLTGMGYQNINDVDPARWGELKTGIEGLAK